MNLMPLISLYEAKCSHLLQDLKNIYQERLELKIYPDQENEFLEMVSGIHNEKLQAKLKAIKTLEWNEFLDARIQYIEFIRNEAWNVFNWILMPVETFNQEAVEVEDDSEAEKLIVIYRAVNNIAYAFMSFFRQYQLRFFDSWYEAWNPECWEKLRILELAESGK